MTDKKAEAQNRPYRHLHNSLQERLQRTQASIQDYGVPYHSSYILDRKCYIPKIFYDNKIGKMLRLQSQYLTWPDRLQETSRNIYVIALNTLLFGNIRPTYLTPPRQYQETDRVLDTECSVLLNSMRSCTYL